MTRSLRPLTYVMLFAVVGCGGDADSGPFGPAESSALLSPFEGEWTIDFEKSIAVQKTEGLTDEAEQMMRKFYQEHPEFGGMHSDITISGNVAVGAGLPSMEYRFFSMHEHDGKVCGKAWHHEDRYDPGDMSKCYVRLSIVDGDLHLEVKMKDGLPDLTDPDFGTTSVEGGSAATCDSEHPPGVDWSDWTTYVFTRKN
jgi:hypothetical protein